MVGPAHPARTFGEQVLPLTLIECVPAVVIVQVVEFPGFGEQLVVPADGVHVNGAVPLEAVYVTVPGTVILEALGAQLGPVVPSVSSSGVSQSGSVG